ncbi:MAG TPA: M23 family metallopeptidase [Gammaproteobacteria bacterium]
MALALAAACALAPVGGSSKDSEVLLSPYLPRTAHQAYGYSLALDGPRVRPAKEWLLAAEHALFRPAAAALPLEVVGRFHSSRAEALGFAFDARGGRRIEIEVRTAASPEAGAAVAASPVFVDLFSAAAGRLEILESAAPARGDEHGARVHRLEVAVLAPERFVLRVQPALEYAGEYRVTVRAAPLLAFPVDGMDIEAIQSGFGAERDGGARSHRGVDIFAPRGTPALAAMDSWVSRVETTRRGGNVVWLQPLFGDLRLYYAHLEEQLVEPGDFVLAGEAVGTVGNTGNAITTPPHLHFGVYVRRRGGGRGGARDPYPFLD